MREEAAKNDVFGDFELGQKVNGTTVTLQKDNREKYNDLGFLVAGMLADGCSYVNILKAVDAGVRVYENDKHRKAIIINHEGE